MQILKTDGTKCPEGYDDFLLACHIHRKCSIEISRNSVNVKFGIKVLRLVKSLIGWDVIATGQASECHFTFARGNFVCKIPVSTLGLVD